MYRLQRIWSVGIMDKYMNAEYSFILSKKPIKGVYNVGCGKPVSVKQILEKIKKLIND